MITVAETEVILHNYPIKEYNEIGLNIFSLIVTAIIWEHLSSPEIETLSINNNSLFPSTCLALAICPCRFAYCGQFIKWNHTMCDLL